MYDLVKYSPILPSIVLTSCPVIFLSAPTSINLWLNLSISFLPVAIVSTNSSACCPDNLPWLIAKSLNFFTASGANSAAPSFVLIPDFNKEVISWDITSGSNFNPAFSVPFLIRLAKSSILVAISAPKEISPLVLPILSLNTLKLSSSGKAPFAVKESITLLVAVTIGLAFKKAVSPAFKAVFAADPTKPIPPATIGDSTPIFNLFNNLLEASSLPSNPSVLSNSVGPPIKSPRLPISSSVTIVSAAADPNAPPNTFLPASDRLK